MVLYVAGDIGGTNSRLRLVRAAANPAQAHRLSAEQIDSGDGEGQDRSKRTVRSVECSVACGSELRGCERTRRRFCADAIRRLLLLDPTSHCFRSTRA